LNLVTTNTNGDHIEKSGRFGDVYDINGNAAYHVKSGAVYLQVALYNFQLP